MHFFPVTLDKKTLVNYRHRSDRADGCCHVVDFIVEIDAVLLQVT